MGNPLLDDDEMRSRPPHSTGEPTPPPVAVGTREFLTKVFERLTPDGKSKLLQRVEQLFHLDPMTVPGFKEAVGTRIAGKGLLLRGGDMIELVFHAAREHPDCVRAAEMSEEWLKQAHEGGEADCGCCGEPFKVHKGGAEPGGLFIMVCADMPDIIVGVCNHCAATLSGDQVALKVAQNLGGEGSDVITKDPHRQ